MRLELRGAVVLVTGAARGIGAAAAREFAARGAHVVVTAREVERARALGLAPGTGGSVECLALDVTDAAGWRRVAAHVRRRFGRLDVLVNNAGVVEPGRTDEQGADAVRRQIDVNLVGTIQGCRAALPLMRAGGRGRIVNVGSMGGIVPMPFEAVYCATKYGVRGYSLALREELRGTGVSVTVVSCDSVDTGILEAELQHDEASLSFVGKPLAPAEVARAIVRAAERGPAEVMVPGATGVLARLLMLFPALLLALLPFLRRIGSRNMQRRRIAAGATVHALPAGAPPVTAPAAASPAPPEPRVISPEPRVIG
jgi:short-subunit dehydrogenase